MRRLVLAAALLSVLGSAAGANDVPPFEANDTGGIIAWSPQAQRYRHDIAADHCARYRKIHRITSMNARHGDYIGFACYWPRGYEPGPDRVIVRRYY